MSDEKAMQDVKYSDPAPAAAVAPAQAQSAAQAAQNNVAAELLRQQQRVLGPPPLVSANQRRTGMNNFQKGTMTFNPFGRSINELPGSRGVGTIATGQVGGANRRYQFLIDFDSRPLKTPEMDGRSRIYPQYLNMQPGKKIRVTIPIMAYEPDGVHYRVKNYLALDAIVDARKDNSKVLARGENTGDRYPYPGVLYRLVPFKVSDPKSFWAPEVVTAFIRTHFDKYPLVYWLFISKYLTVSVIWCTEAYVETPKMFESMYRGGAAQTIVLARYQVSYIEDLDENDRVVKRQIGTRGAEKELYDSDEDEDEDEDEEEEDYEPVRFDTTSNRPAQQQNYFRSAQPSASSSFQTSYPSNRLPEAESESGSDDEDAKSIIQTISNRGKRY